MTQQEYDQKKQECWEEFLRKHEISRADGVTADAFIVAFDRAYALGKKIGNPDFSDAEGEEMLTVKRSDVINEFNKLHKLSYKAADLQLGLNAFRTLFGSKCLPDETSPKEATSAQSATTPEPVEPKNKDSELLHPESVENLRNPHEKSHSRHNSPETADCDNHLADVSKMIDRPNPATSVHHVNAIPQAK